MMASKLLRAIIIGPPGSGKGTIAERILKDFHVKHVSSGDILRSQIAERTDVGQHAEDYIKNGALVPDDVMINLITNQLKTMSNHSWLLDGFPRTVFQAEALMDSTPIENVLNLDVPFEVIIKRIEGRLIHKASGRTYHTEFSPPKKPGLDDETGEPLTQREDDKRETVVKRLDKYHTQTEPVIEYYRNLGKLHSFKGEYSNEIWPHVHKYLSTIIQSLQYTKYE